MFWQDGFDAWEYSIIRVYYIENLSMLSYFSLVFQLIQQALLLNERAFALVAERPEATRVVMGVVFLAGMSSLIGQSVVLFINHVRPRRFLLSVLTNGFLFIISYFIWGVIISLTGRFLFPFDPPAWTVARLVGVSTAPLVFGFFILIPYLGPFIEKLLHVWSLLLLTVIVAFQFQTSLVYALICVGSGWLVMMVLSKTLGRPVVYLRNRLWHGVTGSTLSTTSQDILIDFSRRKS